MKKAILFAGATTLFLSSLSPAHAFGLPSLTDDKSDTGKTLSSLTAIATEASSDSSLDSNALVGALTDKLGVSTDQAAGGAGALLSLAGGALSKPESKELGNLIPGMDSLTGAIPGGLGSMISNMDGVNKAFSALGLDPALIGQFAPIIMQYLGSQDASSGLMGSLGKLWS